MNWKRDPRSEVKHQYRIIVLLFLQPGECGKTTSQLWTASSFWWTVRIISVLWSPRLSLMWVLMLIPFYYLVNILRTWFEYFLNTPQSLSHAQALLSDETISNVPVLVLGNKIDRPEAVSEDKLRDIFALHGQTTGKVRMYNIHVHIHTPEERLIHTPEEPNIESMLFFPFPFIICK